MNHLKPKLLVVDDEAAQRELLKAVLTDEGYEVFEAEDGQAAIAAVETMSLDLVILDLRLGDTDGVSVLERIRQRNADLAVLMITAYATVPTAVSAMKLGAVDYLTKPVDLKELKLVVARTLARQSLQEDPSPKEQRTMQEPLAGIIGMSDKMHALAATIRQVAPTEATVLIQGESGTGKELVANAIHQLSHRTEGPLVKVNCAALPENLLEAELFGHERGAFTGAIQLRKGRFELAHRGTIFLDEIGEMSIATQAKLLRVLQEQQFERVGGGQPITVDVRVIAATNKELRAEVEHGRFREDLFYRLNVFPILVSPLRERKIDIPPLVVHFFQKYNEKNRRSLRGIAAIAMELLTRYNWPGNVRELENAIERAVILARGDEITISELPFEVQKLQSEWHPSEIGVQPGFSLKEVERELIAKTLRQTGGNRTRAAEILGIGRRTLQYKLREYGLE